MSSSTQRRNRITLALGAISTLAFGGMYGLIASNASVTTTGAAPEVLALSNATTTIATATPVPQVASASDDESDDDAAVAKPVPTAAPTVAPTSAATTTTTTHAQTRGS